MADQSPRETEPYFVLGVSQLAMGGAALLMGAVSLIEAVLFPTDRATLSATGWLPTVVTFAAVAYWPFRAGLRTSPARRAAFGALVVVVAEAFVLSLALGLVTSAGPPFPALLALITLYGGALAAYAAICRIQALAVHAIVIAIAAALIAALELRGLRVGMALPLLAGCGLVGDGMLRWRRHRPAAVRGRVGARAVLPRADVDALRRARRRGMEVWVEDGTPELQIGGFAIVAGLASFAVGLLAPGPLSVPSLVAALLLQAVVGLGVLARRRFKERVTDPRSGSVEPRLSRAATVTIVAAIAVLAAGGVAWPPIFAELWRGGHRLDIWPAEQLVAPFATGVLVALGTAWTAWVSGIRTLYHVAASAFVLGALLSLMGFRGSLGAGIVLLVAGLFIAIDGALRMRRYLRRTSA